MNSAVLAPGASVTVIAQLFVPATATLGMVETGTLTATGNVTLVSDDVVDVTVITAGDLQLTKSVAPMGPQVPGTELTYTTNYQNLGTMFSRRSLSSTPCRRSRSYQVGSEDIGTPPASITAITRRVLGRWRRDVDLHSGERGWRSAGGVRRVRHACPVRHDRNAECGRGVDRRRELRGEDHRRVSKTRRLRDIVRQWRADGWLRPPVRRPR